jgi:hypothetical protein
MSLSDRRFFTSEFSIFSYYLIVATGGIPDVKTERRHDQVCSVSGWPIDQFLLTVLIFQPLLI